MEKYISLTWKIHYQFSILKKHIFIFPEKYIFREIEDPEKQRKMEERENRREKKKAQPKMKQLKVN